MSAAASDVSSLVASSFEERLRHVLNRTTTKVGPETKTQLLELVSPESLKIIAGVLAGWLIAHAFGLGEIIDVVLLAAGAFSVGWAIFDGVEHLYEFTSLTYRGRSTGELDAAADHLAKAITILGIQAVLAVLFKGAKRPRTGQGGRLNLGPPPTKQPGLRYRPKVIEAPTAPAGTGFTDWWGDITVSTRGTQTDRALVLRHEKGHQFFVPKLYLLREYRVGSRAGSYVRSSLYRYFEEMVAETLAQVGTHGLMQSFVGLRFPVKNGYVFLMKAGSSLEPSWKGSGVLVEGAALIHTGVVSGFAYNLFFVAGSP